MQNFSKFLDLANNQALIGNTASNSNNDFDNRVYITAENATRTVYVADLPKCITYLELSEFFEEKAGTCTIAIKRPMFKNFYYAFVQFQRRDHAQKILTENRFPEFAGQISRVLPFSKFAVSVGGSAKNGAGAPTSSTTVKHQRDQFNLFVKGLPKEWTHQQLAQVFEQYGSVASAKVSIDFEFKSRGYGFVSFQNEAEGLKAIKELNGLTHAQLAAKNKSKETDADAPAPEEDSTNEATNTNDSEVMTVTEYVQKLDRDGTHLAKTKTNLYVKNFVGDDFTNDQLRELFQPFGEVTSAVVMRDELTGKSKGFGFVCFKDWRDAQKAIDKFANEPAAGPSAEDAAGEETKTDVSIHKELYVTEAKTKEERQAELAKATYQWKRSMQYLNLIVRNVDPETTQEEFDGLFSNFGSIRTSRLHPESSLGFVCFRDREAAQKAKLCSNLQLRGRPITANYCEPREARQKYLEEKWDKRSYERYRASQTSKTSNQDLLSLITSLGMLFNQMSTHTQQGQQHQQRLPGMGGFQQPMNGYRPQNGSSRHFGPATQQMHQPNGQIVQTQQQPQMPQQQIMTGMPLNPANQLPQPTGQTNGGNQQQQTQQQQRPRGQHHQNGYQHQAHQNGHYQQQRNGQPLPMPEPMAASQMPHLNSPSAPVPPVLQPELMQQTHNYRTEIFNLFNSAPFMNATKEEHRKQMVGTAIFRHVTALAGEELAPKITGMIIDLPLADLNFSVSSLDTLTHKVRSAVQLLQETQNIDPQQVTSMPMNTQHQTGQMPITVQQ